MREIESIIEQTLTKSCQNDFKGSKVHFAF